MWLAFEKQCVSHVCHRIIINCHMFVSNLIIVKNVWTRDTATLQHLIPLTYVSFCTFKPDLFESLNSMYFITNVLSHISNDCIAWCTLYLHLYYRFICKVNVIVPSPEVLGKVKSQNTSIRLSIRC